MNDARQARFNFVVDCTVDDLADLRDRWREDEQHLFIDEETQPRLTPAAFDRAFLKALSILAGRMMAGQQINSQSKGENQPHISKAEAHAIPKNETPLVD